MSNTDHFRVARDGPVSVISPVGDLGGLAGDYLPFEVDQLLNEMESERAKLVIVDLSNASFFGSALLAALIRIHKHLVSIDGEMALCEVSDMGRSVLRVCHFEQLWVICDSRQEAKDILLSGTRELKMI